MVIRKPGSDANVCGPLSNIHCTQQDTGLPDRPSGLFTQPTVAEDEPCDGDSACRQPGCVRNTYFARASMVHRKSVRNIFLKIALSGWMSAVLFGLGGTGKAR